jgi:hypothetical protein
MAQERRAMKEAAAEELLYGAGSFVVHKILDIASHDGENL